MKTIDIHEYKTLQVVEAMLTVSEENLYQVSQQIQQLEGSLKELKQAQDDLELLVKQATEVREYLTGGLNEDSNRTSH